LQRFAAGGVFEGLNMFVEYTHPSQIKWNESPIPDPKTVHSWSRILVCFCTTDGFVGSITELSPSGGVRDPVRWTDNGGFELEDNWGKIMCWAWVYDGSNPDPALHEGALNRRLEDKNDASYQTASE
jgi:hypothetical protein